MKFHPYKLAGAGIPDALKTRVVQIHVPESYDEATTLTADGDPNRWLVKGNQQFLLDEERAAKAVAESEEVAKLVAAGDIEGAFALVQAEATNYRDGGGRKAGVPNVTKQKAAAVDTAKGKLAGMDAKKREAALKVLADLGMGAELFATAGA